MIAKCKHNGKSCLNINRPCKNTRQKWRCGGRNKCCKVQHRDLPFSWLPPLCACGCHFQTLVLETGKQKQRKLANKLAELRWHVPLPEGAPMQPFSTSCPPSRARVGPPAPDAARKLADLWATGIHGTSWPSSLFMFYFSQCSSLHRGIWKSLRHWLSFFTHISLSIELFSKEVRSYIIDIIWSVILLFCP